MTQPITSTAVSLEGQLLEIARELEVREQVAGVNKVTLALNMDTKIMTITARLDFEISGDGDDIVISALPYLANI